MKNAKEGAKTETVGVAEFKARCLELLERVRRRRTELVVTKRGEPIARVVPAQAAARPLKGLLRDRVAVEGDIVHVDWSAEWDATR